MGRFGGSTMKLCHVRDRRGLHDAAALVAIWHGFVLGKNLTHPFHLETRPTDQTRTVTVVAVELDHLFVRDTGYLMQPVDVLCDDRADLALGNELSDGKMSGIGFGIGPTIRFQTAPPRLAAGLLRGDEVLELDRLDLVPEAGVCAAVIRDSRLGRDTGAGEDDGPLGALDEVRQCSLLFVHAASRPSCYLVCVQCRTIVAIVPEQLGQPFYNGHTLQSV
jgi:hypothetical protein